MTTTTKTPLTVRLPEAAAITGIPRHVLEKSFMRPDRRPRGIPEPPPHIRIGKAIHILAAKLPAWVEGLGNPTAPQKRKPGRPTKAEQIARRKAAEAAAIRGAA